MAYSVGTFNSTLKASLNAPLSKL